MSERAASAADVEVEVGIRPRMRRPVQNTYRTANFQTIDLDTLTLEDVKELLAGNARSFFADCNRDSHGYCLPDWTVLVKDEKEIQPRYKMQLWMEAVDNDLLTQSLCEFRGDQTRCKIPCTA